MRERHHGRHVVGFCDGHVETILFAGNFSRTIPKPDASGTSIICRTSHLTIRRHFPGSPGTFPANIPPIKNGTGSSSPQPQEKQCSQLASGQSCCSPQLPRSRFGALDAGAWDCTKPTTPGNFRVTARTAYSVTVAWSPSTDNSGNFNYHLPCLQRSTSSPAQNGHEPYFRQNLIHKRLLLTEDAAGNVSGQGTQLPDASGYYPALGSSCRLGRRGRFNLRQIPAHLRRTTVSAADRRRLDGSLYSNITFPRNVTSLTLQFLSPDTTYSLQVRGYDAGNNCSPFSDPAIITTLPTNCNDNTPAFRFRFRKMRIRFRRRAALKHKYPGHNPLTISMPRPTSATTSTSMAGWKTSCLIRRAKDHLLRLRSQRHRGLRHRHRR